MSALRSVLLMFPLVLLGAQPLLRAQLYFPDYFYSSLTGKDFVSLATIPEGSPVGNVFQDWGIRIRSEPPERDPYSDDASESFVVLRRIPCVPPPINIPEPIPCSPYEFFSNDIGHPEDPAHRNRPLVISFDRPVERVQFVLANGTDDMTVAFRGYDLAGRELGQLSYSYLNHSEEQPFTDPVLIGTTSPNGISTLVVDYEESDRAEQLGQLRVAFLHSPVYETYIPLIASGRLASGESLSTSITIMGLSNTTSWGWMTFSDPTGRRLPIQFDKCDDPDLIDCGGIEEIRFGGGQPFRMVTPPNSGNPITASAHITTVGGPISVEATFTITDHDQIVSQAGIASVSAGWRLSGYARYRPALTSGTVGPGSNHPEINTGIAIANASWNEVTAHVVLQASSGRAQSGKVTLPAGGQVSKFVTEIFPEFSEEGFEGRVWVTANGPIAATFLETQNGVVLSSLPGISLPRALPEVD